MIWIESAATFFGLLCVWLTIRQNIWCWPTGLIQVILFIFVFYSTKLYSDLILHVIYVVMQIYGWYHWLHGGTNNQMLNVTTQTVRQTLFWVATAFLGAFAWGHFMATHTDAAAPYADAFVVVASLIAQWLMARKIIESWLFWISVDSVAIGVYLYKSLFVTTGLYTVFLLMAISGYFAWRRTLTQNILIEPAT